jgi:hypothetical protein
MEDKVMIQILEELREIKQDLHWFRIREELKQRAVWEIENPNLTTADRAKALAAFVQKSKQE